MIKKVSFHKLLLKQVLKNSAKIIQVMMTVGNQLSSGTGSPLITQSSSCSVKQAQLFVLSTEFLHCWCPPQYHRPAAIQLRPGRNTHTQCYSLLDNQLLQFHCSIQMRKGYRQSICTAIVNREERHKVMAWGHFHCISS